MNPATTPQLRHEDRELLAALDPAAVIFDFDGTLVHTDALNTDAIRASFTDLAITVPDAWLHNTALADLTVLRTRLRDDLGLDLPGTDAQFVDRTRAHWLNRAHRIRPMPRVAAAARHLSAGLPVAIATANDGRLVRAALKLTGLDSLFETLVAREHVTRLKPAPDAYHLAAQALAQAPGRCLAFENTDDGLTSALTAGIPVIDVRHASWTPQHP
ncbi:HAD family hydrolase [Streptomyces sp. NPDC054887]